MKNICFYFEVHQPYRVSRYSVFDLNTGKNYFDGPDQVSNRKVFEKVAQKCYLPANRLFLELLQAHPNMRISYSLSGVFLEQCQEFGQIGHDVLKSFQDLAETGQVEFLAETYYHSLSSIYSPKEFKRQVARHIRLIRKLFGVKPKIFRNTELIYNNHVAYLASQMHFKGILLEGWDYVLQGRSPNHVYRPPKNSVKRNSFGLLLKNYRLSDDIAFRFSNKQWNEHPLTVDKFLNWVESCDGEFVNLFMDYETFGEHQWADTGIFEFLRHLPSMCENRGIGFRTPAQILEGNLQNKNLQILDIHHYLSWADMERDLSAWMGNELQRSCLQRVFELEEKVLKTKKRKLIDIWRKLQTSDHFYYMSTKYWSDGDVHKYFSPFESPYDAFMSYMNVLTDFEQTLQPYLPR